MNIATLTIEVADAKARYDKFVKENKKNNKKVREKKKKLKKENDVIKDKLKVLKRI